MRTSLQIRAEIGNIPTDTRLARVRYLAAKQRLDILSEIALSELVYPKGGEDLNHIENSGSGLAAYVMSPAGAELAALTAVIGIIKGSPQYQDAQNRLHPLLVELDAALAAEADHRAKITAAELAVAEAEEAARVKALAKVETDATVRAARENLAEITN